MSPEEQRRLAALQQAHSPARTPGAIVEAAAEFDRFLSGAVEREAEVVELDGEQLRRGVALNLAAELIKGKAVFGSSGVPEGRDIADLVDLAEYLLDGTHPNDRYADTPPEPVRLISGEAVTPEPPDFD